jgi:hypothetical protein
VKRKPERHQGEHAADSLGRVFRWAEDFLEVRILIPGPACQPPPDRDPPNSGRTSLALPERSG